MERLEYNNIVICDFLFNILILILIKFTAQIDQWPSRIWYHLCNYKWL